jgi:S-adenosylmethionine decarboxylase
MDHFEGTEKLLEIWFTKLNSKCTAENDLRDIPRECLDYILDLVNCKILSCTRTRDIDSYVLSESSLFLSKQRLLIKTCGTTTLLHSVRPFIEAAFKFCRFDHIQDLYYSRKRFARPELQKSPHSSFEEEVEYLQDLFDGGSAYALGKLNGTCWYLYTLNRPMSIIEPDQTLEVIMTKLDPEVMKIFTKEVSSCCEEATRKSKIDTLFPNAILDAYLFDPCGYSVNGILPKGYYFTIHITPEEHCSYVSFETNAPENDYPGLVKRVLDMFKPGQFIVTFFANQDSVGRNFKNKQFTFSGFNHDDYLETKVKNYNVTYSHYTKKPI